MRTKGSSIFLIFVSLLSVITSIEATSIIKSPAKSIPTSKREPKVSFVNSILDNFHSVEKNALYRSAQLAAHKLGYYVKRLGIKTLVNLRGAKPKSPWWQKEKKVAKEHNLAYYNIPMYSASLPEKNKILKLLSIYNKAPRPILIHCLGGADRSGEASALWVMEQQKKPKKVALKQLSLKYRHIEARYPAKRFFINLWEGPDWLRKAYDPFEYPRYFSPMTLSTRQE